MIDLYLSLVQNMKTLLKLCLMFCNLVEKHFLICLEESVIFMVLLEYKINQIQQEILGTMMNQLIYLLVLLQDLISQEDFYGMKDFTRN